MRFSSRKGGLSLALGLLFFAAATNALAEPMTLKAVAQQAVLSNPEVLARYHAFKASEDELEAVTSVMLPHLDYTASHGKEDRNDPQLKRKFSYDTHSLQLTQLLWDGLSSWDQKRQFDHARLVRLYEFFDASESAALEVSRVYFDVLRYRKLVELAEDNYVQHRSVFEQIEAKVKAGVGRRVDLEQAAGRMALAESNLVVEISNLHDVSARFQRLVGVPPDQIMDSPPLMTEGIPASIKTSLEQSMSVSPQVRAAIENVRASAYARDSRRGAYQPKIEFRLRQDRGGDIGGIGGNTRNNVAEVVLNFNIFNGFGDVARVDQATELYNASRDQRDKACRDVRQTAAIAFNDVRKLIEQKTYLDQHRLSVEKARDAYRKQFDIGQRSLLDLLDTENELFQAKRAEVNADLDLATAYARVHGGAGKLLPALGLSAVNNGLTGEIKDWKTGEESPDQCPPEPVIPYVADKSVLNDRAAEMTRAKVKAMLDAMAARQAAGGDAAVGIAPTPSAPTQLQEKAVITTMTEWTNAWMQRDLAAYLALYSPTLNQNNAWVKSRRAVISKAKEIKIIVTSQKLDVRDATHVSASFHQSYVSPDFSDEVDKVLEWELIGGHWLIVTETASNTPAAASGDKSKNPAQTPGSR